MKSYLDLVQLIISMFAVVISFVALICARRAQKESQISNLLMAQIDTLRKTLYSDKNQNTSLCNNQHSIQLALDPMKEFDCCTNEPVYKNFFLYFVENAETLKYSELNGKQICQIWSVYCKALMQRAEYEYIFQNIYNCVNMIDKSNLPNEKKSEYISQIANQLTSEQLFCYFVNQIAVCSGDINTNDPYVKKLKKYEFMKNLFSNKLFEDVQGVIPAGYVKLFSSYALNAY